MSSVFNRDMLDAAEAELYTSSPIAVSNDLYDVRPGRTASKCHHCGEPCTDTKYIKTDKSFCCHGCLFVHDLLIESGLNQFYDLVVHPGTRMRSPSSQQNWEYLDDPLLQRRLLDFSDAATNRITLHIPAIHCVACVWLLESLFRLNPGIGSSRVNFARREVAIQYSPSKVRLSELVRLLTSVGYEPVLTLGELEKSKSDPARKRQWLQLGIAGFAFGNIMLFSIPTYLGLDGLTGTYFQRLFGYLSLFLALPVFIYSACDYWRAAAHSLKHRVLTLDVPIAVGIAALFFQSAFEIFSGRGGGYLDSLAGLIFFLLCGRVFQRVSHDRIIFDRDYKSFFPLAVIKKLPGGEQSSSISELAVGDHLILRNGELIPADARLVAGSACIDYSFVTGESEHVEKELGDYLYAGGQQIGGAIEVETLKPVSQSYLTSLWNHETFQKQRDHNLNTLTNRYSRRFTRIVLTVAIGAALFWILNGDASRGLKAFISVLIVACPCALALAAPFALGSAQRLLARIGVFLKSGLVLERLAQLDSIVFDKTGTLTACSSNGVTFNSGQLEPREAASIATLTSHSTHPHAIRIRESLSTNFCETTTSFVEVPGYGIRASIRSDDICLGSRAWLERCGVTIPKTAIPSVTGSLLSINGTFRGTFVLGNPLRPETAQLLMELGGRYELALLSGDNERERKQFSLLFPPGSALNFNQSPLDKLEFITNLQDSGRQVLMIGDGLNDAGALKQSDVGMAVVEKIGAFCPASDVIISASQIPKIGTILEFSRRTAKIIEFSFVVSAVYNLVGISIAAAGILSPIICAVLMPLSSITVVLFACALTTRSARNVGIVQNTAFVTDK